MGVDTARQEIVILVRDAKSAGKKTTKDIPNGKIVSVAQKNGLGAREVLDLLDEAWSAA